MRKIEQVIVHCSDTTVQMDIGLDEVRQWHVEERGWNDVGYHDIIRRDGTHELGRELEVIGAHARGYNSSSIGICLVGGRGPDGKPEFNFTGAQMLKLRSLVSLYRDRFPGIEVIGHRDVSAKPCPAFNVKSYFSVLETN